MEAAMKSKRFSLSVALLVAGGGSACAGGYALRVSPGVDVAPRIPVTVGVVRPTYEGVHRNQALASAQSGANTPWGPFASPFVVPPESK
jgi:hypothetical protein